MASRRTINGARNDAGGAYRDRIPLEEDFELINARTSSLYGPSRLPVQTNVLSLHSEWTVGSAWAPDDSLEFDLDPSNEWFDEAVGADVGDVMEDLISPKPKKNRNQASSRPSVYWKQNKQELYLDELLRHEGRGDFARERCCTDCLSRGVSQPFAAEFRCTDCFLGDLTCSSCLIRRHRLNPFHSIERWDGNSFVKSSLKDVGLVIHLNHASLRCPVPAACDERLRVIHTTGVHEVALSYCACSREIPRDLQLLRRGLYPATHQQVRTCVTFSLLKLLHLLSLMGKVSVYDMYRSIERLTNNTGISMPRSRYRPTMRCLTQWRHLKSLKRGGRGHEPTGAAGTSDGELAIPCPSCPHPGINMATNWDSEPEDKLYLYTKYISMDANFRLKNNLVSNFSVDPGLSNGAAYMVPRARYEEYVLSQADSEDISTCVGFQALAKATTQNTRGLRYTGVCGAMCSRSEMILPNAMGNLQKGERYANMDYIFACSIKATQLLLVAICYDIACQWFVNLFQRMPGWPEELRPRTGLNLRPLIPKFHEPAHLEKDHEQYSFNIAVGVGLTDGECPERVWGSHNALGGSTRTMGPGTREDTLDDNFGHWNWLKYIHMGKMLLKKYRGAISERNKQQEAHRGFSATLPSELVGSWEQMCVEWDADAFPKTLPNPFKTLDESLSEEEVQRQLNEHEAALQKNSGQIPLHATSATSFVAMGLELEDSQRRLKVLALEQAHIPKSLQNTSLRDQRRLVQDRIQSWQMLQAIYMPGLLQIQTDCGQNPTAVWSSHPNPEDVELWLPSSVPENRRQITCMEGLPAIELQLRTAQCSGSLQALRQALRVKTRMVYFKNKNVRGQREGTRSRAIIDRVHQKAIRYVQKYRAARRAKLSLEGHGSWEDTFRQLQNEDVRGFNTAKRRSNPARRGIWEDGHAPAVPAEREALISEDEQSDLDLNNDGANGPRPKKKRKTGTGETRKELSWIWCTTAFSIDSDHHDDILRAEWARSRARVLRTSEEVALLREEMNRVLLFLEWRATQWDSKAFHRHKLPLELQEGLSAYAVGQALLQRALAVSFKKLWVTPLADVDNVLENENHTDFNTEDVLDNDVDSDYENGND